MINITSDLYHFVFWVKKKPIHISVTFTVAAPQLAIIQQSTDIPMEQSQLSSNKYWISTHHSECAERSLHSCGLRTGYQPADLPHADALPWVAESSPTNAGGQQAWLPRDSVPRCHLPSRGSEAGADQHRARQRGKQQYPVDKERACPEEQKNTPNRRNI